MGVPTQKCLMIEDTPEKLACIAKKRRHFIKEVLASDTDEKLREIAYLCFSDKVEINAEMYDPNDYDINLGVEPEPTCLKLSHFPPPTPIMLALVGIKNYLNWLQIPVQEQHQLSLILLRAIRLAAEELAWFYDTYPESEHDLYEEWHQIFGETNQPMSFSRWLSENYPRY